jgi:hypothetical protein
MVSSSNARQLGHLGCSQGAGEFAPLEGLNIDRNLLLSIWKMWLGTVIKLPILSLARIFITETIAINTSVYVDITKYTP